MNQKIRALVVDDAVVYRLILKNVLGNMSGVECVGQAKDGTIAIRKTKELKPDLILLDIEMPVMDGFETLKKIREFDKEVEIVIVSTQNPHNARKTLQTLNAGALDFIPKPITQDRASSEAELIHALYSIINAVRITKNTRSIGKPGLRAQIPTIKKPLKTPAVRRHKRNPPKKVELVLIGISTGGPKALEKLIPTISPELTCPIFIVQHMPAIFTKQLAERLNFLTTLRVREARSGDIPEPGEILLAPGGIHTTLVKQGHSFQVALINAPPVNNCKPSIDVLFDSVANFEGENVVTVIMTGMGVDGANGVRALSDRGSYSIIQDEATSTIWGMPKAVKENGDYDEELSLHDIGKRISRIVLGNGV